MPDLRPCPFCGGKTIHPGSGNGRNCICVDCNVYGPMSWKGHPNRIAGWNTRPIEDALRERVVTREMMIEAIREWCEYGSPDRWIADFEKEGATFRAFCGVMVSMGFSDGRRG